MNFPPDLLGLLEEWSLLSSSEEAALQTRDWSALARAHARKDTLQERIRSFPNTDHWLRSPLGQDWIGRLLAQERHNAAMLATQRQAAESLRADGLTAMRHLRQIHEAYGSRQSMRWQSYS